MSASELQQEDADLARAIQLSLIDAGPLSAASFHTQSRPATATMVSPPPAVHPSWHARTPPSSDATAADEQYARLLQQQFDREASQGSSSAALFNPHHPTGPCLQPRRIKIPEHHSRRNSPTKRTSPPQRACPPTVDPPVLDARSQHSNACPQAPSDAWWGTTSEQRQQAVVAGTPAVTRAPGPSAAHATLPRRGSPAPYVDPTAVARGEACAGCHRYFGFMDGLRRVTAMGSSWHASCFACAHCGAAFQGQATFVVGSDGKPYHQQCHTIKFVPQCSVCHTHIAADVRFDSVVL